MLVRGADDDKYASHDVLRIVSRERHRLEEADSQRELHPQREHPWQWLF